MAASSASRLAVGLYQPTYGVYAATKAAVEALTQVLARDLGERSITVNAVAPGPIGTELFLDSKPQEAIDKIAGMTPLHRLGEPLDVACVVSFLVGPDGDWITGQVLRVNGGIVQLLRMATNPVIAVTGVDFRN